jgi:hypothetical protein
MKIAIRLRQGVLSATLDSNEAGNAFAAMLPLELNLSDYAGTEKIADLPQRLPDADAARGYRPRAGDIAFYAPWGNLAIFHKDFSHSSGLIRIGRIAEGVEKLAVPGEVQVTIEHAG